MLYDNYLIKVSERFKSRFDEIDPHWNFDQGVEFESTLAMLIDELLPDKFGVCQGFVTCSDGQKKGDDIIIYDKLSVPLLKPAIPHQFTRKEDVPIEATFTYIEAKNTLELADSSKGTYIGKAVDQAREVKLLPRKERSLQEILPGIKLSNILKVESSEGQPIINNPMYTAVFARGARINGKIVEDTTEIKKQLNGLDLGDDCPDLIVINENLVLAPYFHDDLDKIRYESPFIIDGRHNMMMWEMPKMAYGFALTSILYALQRIHLADVAWHEVLGEALTESWEISMAKKTS